MSVKNKKTRRAVDFGELQHGGQREAVFHQGGIRKANIKPSTQVAQRVG